MSCLGVHFALTEKEVDKLRAIRDEEARLDYLQTEIEEDYFADHREYVAETDKAWDALHRALADGQLTWVGGEYPLNHTVLAGELLYTESDYIMSLKSPAQVRDISAALALLTEPDFRKRYDKIDTAGYAQGLSDEDFNYTWDGFQAVRELFARAAQEGRFVLFTADQ